MNSKPTVLILQTAFIGDVILATGLVESIVKKFPEARIDFLVRKGNEGLLKGNPGLREVLILDKQRKYSSLFELIGQLRKMKYDYAINVQRFATSGLITALSGASIKIGFDKNPFAFLFDVKVGHDIGASHEVERNLKLLAPLGISELARPKLYPSVEQLEMVKRYKSEAYITVSPASVWFTKQWPREQWVDFLLHVGDRKVYLLGGSDDSSMCEEILNRLSGRHAENLAGKLSLVQSAALMKDAQMNFVNDSAPLHLASAMNAPVTSVFCSTVPSFGFGPLSDKSMVIETQEKLECRPCGLHGYAQCPKGHFRCATTIKREQLLAALA